MPVSPAWSLEAVMRDFEPHPSWRASFAEAYALAMESPAPEQQLRGWRAAAVIFGDMNALLLCLFVCHHGLALAPSEGRAFRGHIDLCSWDMGLATPSRGETSVAVADLGKPETLRRDDDAARAWLDEQLRPFGGDVARAAPFAMRLTAIRLGLLRGPAEPSIAQVLDASSWQRVADSSP